MGCKILYKMHLIFLTFSIWTMMMRLVTALQCSPQPSYTYLLNLAPEFQLALFITTTYNPIRNDIVRIYRKKSFDYFRPLERDFEIEVPMKTRLNGTLYLQVVFALKGEPLDWRSLYRGGPTFIHTIKLSEYIVPAIESSNLLDEEGNNNVDRKKSKFNAKQVVARPVTHLMSNVYVSLLTENISLSHHEVPSEMAPLLHVTHTNHILPIFRTDFYKSRLQDLVKVAKNTDTFSIRFHYNPIRFEDLRQMLRHEEVFVSLYALGFSKKGVDIFKGVFSNSSMLVIWILTFVAFKPVLLCFRTYSRFLKRKGQCGGLSMRATIWSAVSQSIIFLYLFDKNASRFVLMPAFASVLVDLWKFKKILNLEFGVFYIRKKCLTSWQYRKNFKFLKKEAEKFDKKVMRYLRFVLWSLCICGAIYSLFYKPHRSWYSWTLQSLVNGAYSFGFLLMLQQLFINYRHKSVANLSWRAFIWKAFKNFINYDFPFILAMLNASGKGLLPGVVYIIYSYHRWLYPMDRLDTDIMEQKTDETEEVEDSEIEENEGDSEKKNQ